MIDLQEAPLVAILSLSTHPLIPRILLEKACADVVSKFFFSKDDVIREVSVIIMKTFYLYDQAIVNAAIPPERAYLMESGDDMPKLYGSEYGEMIEEYLQHIVENRRDMHYLLEKVLPEDLERLQVTQAELESYQNTFMELDLTCQGTLGIIEVEYVDPSSLSSCCCCFTSISTHITNTTTSISSCFPITLCIFYLILSYSSVVA